MSGKRIFGFREGDRSEYLAQYMLSRFSYVYSFPRQEDFGIADFLCILTKVENKNVYPETGYYVRVKSTEEDIKFDYDAVKWISLHMDLPLIICVINKETSHIKLYTCSKMWAGLFAYHLPNELIVQLNEGADSQYVEINRDKKFIKVKVGKPILSMNIEEVEKRKDECYNILKPWIELDKLNLARKSIGRIFCRGYLNWLENEHPKNGFNQYTFGKDYHKAEEDLAQILTALAGSYRGAKEQDRLESIINLLRHYEKYLDKFGIDFINNDFTEIDSIFDSHNKLTA